MIFKRNHKQQIMFDEWDKLGPKRRKLLEESWAGLFREHILYELPVDELASFFSDDFGRPTKELYTVMGVLLLQQMYDLTDEETIMRLAFDMQWHYALDIPEESDVIKYISSKTLWTMRKLITDNRLEDKMFIQPTEKLKKLFDVDTKLQRIDSVHTKSNMRNLGRIGILSQGNKKFLVNLRRHYKKKFYSLPEDIKNKYLSKKEKQCFGMVKPSESRKTLKSTAEDLFFLIRIFERDESIVNMDSYKQLCRILKEQCTITESTEGEVIELKPAKEVPSSSLQNPSDPDAGYSGHKGQGYSTQIMETYCASDDEETKKTTLNLITYVEVDSADNSDAKALIPAIETTEKNNFKPEEILADSLYGSDENRQQAKAKNVELISPVMGQNKKDGYHIGDFVLSEKNEILQCPIGHKPEYIKKNKKRYSAGFDKTVCSACPTADNCCAKKGKKYYYVRYTEKDIRIAKRRLKENSFEFKDKYRFRAGVEATMSEYDRKTGVKHLRVRRSKAVRYCVFLKALAVNILRAAAVRKARARQNQAAKGLFLAFFILILNFKELFQRFFGKPEKIFVKMTKFA